MSRQRLLLAGVLAAAVWLAAGGAAAAVQPPTFQLEGDFLPASPGGGGSGPGAPLYDRYPVWHYVYGARLDGPDTVHRLVYLVNTIQVAKAWLLKLAIRTAEYALRVDLVGPLVSRAGLAMEQLAASLWEQDGAALVQAGLAVAGLLALGAYLFRGHAGAGLRILAGAGVVLLGSYALFAGAPEALVSSAGVARALGSQVVAALGAVAPAGPGGPEERLLRGAGERAWEALVLDPWIVGEFTPDAVLKEEYRDGDVPGGAWLARTPTERMRQYALLYNPAVEADFVQGSAGHYWDYLPRRVVLTAVTALATLVYAGAMILTGGGVLYYQFLLLALLALAPLWLILALWHPGGLQIVRGVAVRGVGALAAQVVLMAVLGVMLLLTPAVWVATAPLGWLAQGLMMALLAAVLYRYRFRWLTWAWAPPAPEPAAAPVPAVTGASRPAVARGAEAGPVVILPPPAPVPPALEPSFAVAEAAPEPGWAESRPGWERDLEEELRLLRYRLAQVATREAGRTLPAMPVGPREPLAPGWPGERVPPGSGEATDAVGPEPVLGEVAAGTPAGPAVGYRQRPPHRPEEGDLHLYRGRWR